ncbi:hypothetical protein ABVT39_003076 [Epinephelus coioides]
MMQGCNNVITQYYDSTQAFQLKLVLWEVQLSNGDPAQFPHLRNVSATGTDADMNRYKDKIVGLQQEFQQRFQVLGELETEFSIFGSPFTVKASDLPVDIQLEVIDLQCDSDLTWWAWILLYQYLLSGYPKLTALAAVVMCMFGTTYLVNNFFCDEHQ